MYMMEARRRRKRIFRKKIKKNTVPQRNREDKDTSDDSTINDDSFAFAEAQGVKGNYHKSSQISREYLMLDVVNFVDDATKTHEYEYNDFNSIQISREFVMDEKINNYRDLVAQYSKERGRTNNAKYSKSLTKLTKSKNLLYDSNTKCCRHSVSQRRLGQMEHRSQDSVQLKRCSSQNTLSTYISSKSIIECEGPLRNQRTSGNYITENVPLRESNSNYFSVSCMSNKIVLDFTINKKNIKKSISKQLYGIETLDKQKRKPVYRSCLQLGTHNYVKSLNPNNDGRHNELGCLNETSCCSFTNKCCNSNANLKNSCSQYSGMSNNGSALPIIKSDRQFKNYGSHTNCTCNNVPLTNNNSTCLNGCIPTDNFYIDFKECTNNSSERRFSKELQYMRNVKSPLKVIRSCFALDTLNGTNLVNHSCGEQLNEFNNQPEKPCCSHSVGKNANVVHSSYSLLSSKSVKRNNKFNNQHIKKPFKVLRKIDKLKTPYRSKASKAKIADANAYLAEEIKQYNYISKINFSQNVVEGESCEDDDEQNDSVMYLQPGTSTEYISIENEYADEEEICENQQIACNRLNTVNDTNEFGEETNEFDLENFVHIKKSGHFVNEKNANNVSLMSQNSQSNNYKNNNTCRCKCKKKTLTTKRARNFVRMKKSRNLTLMLGKQQSNCFQNTSEFGTGKAAHETFKQSHKFVKTKKCGKPSTERRNLKSSYQNMQNVNHSTEGSIQSGDEEAHHRKLKRCGEAIIIHWDHKRNNYQNICQAKLYISAKGLSQTEITELSQNENYTKEYQMAKKRKLNRDSSQLNCDYKIQIAERSIRCVQKKKSDQPLVVCKKRNGDHLSQLSNTKDLIESELDESRETQRFNAFVNMSEHECSIYKNEKSKNYIKVCNSIHLKRIGQPSEEMQQFNERSNQLETLISTSKTSKFKLHGLEKTSSQKSHKVLLQSRGIQTSQTLLKCSCGNDVNFGVTRETGQHLLPQHEHASINAQKSYDRRSSIESIVRNYRKQAIVLVDNLMERTFHDLVKECSSYTPFNNPEANLSALQSYPIRTSAFQTINTFSNHLIACDTISNENDDKVDSSIPEVCIALSTEENESLRNPGDVVNGSNEGFEIVRFSRQLLSKSNILIFRMPDHILEGCLHFIRRNKIQKIDVLHCTSSTK